jgi:hypothetical protein
VADWTTIITAVGAAGVAGGFGYLGARKQAEIALAQVRGENERLREQHREDHLRNRQGTYHRMLSADREFLTILEGTGRDPGVDADAYYEDIVARFREWHDLATAVVLFGTEEAREATLALMDAYDVVVDKAASLAAERDGDEPRAFVDAMSQEGGPIREARVRLIAAMRDDVGPR